MLSSLIDPAGAWFLQSGIQEPNGGVARYYRAEAGRNARISTEITGYAASFLVFLHARTGKPEYLAAAERAGQFLIRDAWHREWNCFPFEYPVDANAAAYFFDSGIIVRGLLALWRATKNADYLAAARACGVGMASDFRRNGEMDPILRLPQKDPEPRTAQWSRSPGCYQLKSAMCWHDLFHATGDEMFCRLYTEAVNTAMASAGSFLPDPAGEGRTMDRLHAFCYYLEGLLPVVQQSAVRTALLDGIDRTAFYLRDIASRFVRSDVYAQLLRVRLLANAAGLPLQSAEAAAEAAAMPAFQWTGADSRLQGGFGFGRKEGQMMPFANPVSTSFCVQALCWWNDYEAGLPLPPVSTLI